MTQPQLLSAFTPSTMQPATLEAIFVKREPLVQRIIDSVSAAARGEGIEHHIAVGPRGIGKTHLLSLITYRLLCDPMFLERAVVAWLREEEWGISSVGELYEAILKQLASADTPILAVHIAATAAVEQLAGASFEDLADEAEHLLTKVLDDRRAVVVVENLDLLFATIGTDDQHRLRAYLQNEENLVLLASTPSLSESISLRKGLFFGFFAIHWLDELTLDEARELLELIAELRNDEEGRKLTAYLQTDEATRRLQTVQALAGGHPRLWVLMADCITTERLEEVVDLLLAVLDDLTPYYQSQMAALTPQQRKIVMVLSRAEGALPPKDIASRGRIQERVAAKQLGDLTKLGYVRVAELPDGVEVNDKRIRPYELREPLLRHVLEVKESRGKPLRLIVEFLRAWYDRSKLEEWSAQGGALETLYATAALEQTGAGDHVIALYRDGRFDEALTRFDQEAADGNVSALGHLVRASILHHLGRDQEAVDDARAAVAIDPRNPAARNDLGSYLEDVGDLEGALNAFQAAVAMAPSDSVARANLGTILARLLRYDEALTAFERALELDSSNEVTRVNRAMVLRRLERLDEALAEMRAAHAANPADATILLNLGTVLADTGELQEAAEAFRACSVLAPDNAEASFNLGIVLRRLDEDLAALAAYDRAIELNPTMADARWNRLLVETQVRRIEIDPSELAEVIRTSVQGTTINQNLDWLLQVISGQPRLMQAQNVKHVSSACSTTGAMPTLALVVAQSVRWPWLLDRHRWLREWAQELAHEPHPVALLVVAVNDYLTSGDGQILQSLPRELRDVALDIIGTVNGAPSETPS